MCNYLVLKEDIFHMFHIIQYMKNKKQKGTRKMSNITF